MNDTQNPPRRLCVNCRHFTPNSLFSGRMALEWGHCDAFFTSYSPIDGTPNEKMHAKNARDILGPCKPEGIEWEAAP